MHVTIYTKPGCHLCEDVLVILDRLTPQYNLEVTEVNILDDMALYEAYHNTIPVVKLEDGRLGTLEAPIDEPTLRAAFETARHALPPSSRPTTAAGSYVQPYRSNWFDRLISSIGRHWLLLACIALGIFVGLPWLAAVFAWLGWWTLADPLYTAYALTCHQLPERAGSVFGYQVAFCYRNTALYGGVFLFGIMYGLARDRNVSRLQWLRRPAPWWALVLLLLPMAVDGFTHLLGLRDNMLGMSADPTYGMFMVGPEIFSFNWWLRVLTGLTAALGVVWFAFPRMDRAVEESESLQLLYQQSAVARQQPA